MVLLQQIWMNDLSLYGLGNTLNTLVMPENNALTKSYVTDCDALSNIL